MGGLWQGGSPGKGQGNTGRLNGGDYLEFLKRDLYANLADRLGLVADSHARHVGIRGEEDLVALGTDNYALGTGSTSLGSLLLAALPLSVLFAALLVLGPRKNS